MLKWMLLLLLASCGIQENSYAVNEVVLQKQIHTEDSQAYVHGQLLVVFTPGVTEQQAKARITRLGGSIIRGVSKQRLYQVQLSQGIRTEDEMMKYQHLRGVESVGFNYKRRLR